MTTRRLGPRGQPAASRPHLDRHGLPGWELLLLTLWLSSAPAWAGDAPGVGLIQQPPPPRVMPTGPLGLRLAPPGKPQRQSREEASLARQWRAPLTPHSQVVGE